MAAASLGIGCAASHSVLRCMRGGLAGGRKFSDILQELMAFPACLKGFLGILSLVESEGRTFDTSTGFQQPELKIIEVSR